jgi:hypothetical protein
MDELGKKIAQPLSKVVKLDKGNFFELMDNKQKID